MSDDDRSVHSVGPFIVDTYDPLTYRMELPALPTLEAPVAAPLDDADELESYSQQFLSAAMRKHPEWRALAQKLVSDGESANLRIEIAAPSSKIDTLWLETEPGQITVGLGAVYHVHFCAYHDESDDNVFSWALKFVDDIISEQLMLVVAMRGEMIGRSWVQSPLEPIDASQVPCAVPPAHDRLRCLSWKSTFDRDVAAPANWP